jgi:hypothetical protein
VDTRSGLDDVEKRKFLTLPGLELLPSVFQPVARLYTDYAIPALSSWCNAWLNTVTIYLSITAAARSKT